MKRYYLDELGITSRPDTNWGLGEDDRDEKWQEQREKYGFDDREIYSLDFTFYLWLYERLMMYNEIAGKVINLEYHKFMYKDKEYTQLELINLLIEDCKYLIKNGESDDYELINNKRTEVGEVWTLILPDMWW